MLSASSTIRVASLARVCIKRNIGSTAVVMQKVQDPIQQLFVDKIKEYSQKKNQAGGKLVDSNPEVEGQLKKELEKVAIQYGGKSGEDMTKFPQFTFKDPEVKDFAA